MVPSIVCKSLSSRLVVRVDRRRRDNVNEPYSRLELSVSHVSVVSVIGAQGWRGPKAKYRHLQMFWVTGTWHSSAPHRWRVDTLPRLGRSDDSEHIAECTRKRPTALTAAASSLIELR